MKDKIINIIKMARARSSNDNSISELFPSDGLNPVRNTSVKLMASIADKIKETNPEMGEVEILEQLNSSEEFHTKAPMLKRILPFIILNWDTYG